MSHPRNFAKSHPDQPAVIISESKAQLTYRELEEKANQGAHLMRQLDLRAGDTIALWLPNGLAYFELYWAAVSTSPLVAPS